MWEPDRDGVLETALCRKQISSARRSSIRAPLSSHRIHSLFVRSNSSISDEFTVCCGGRRLEEVPFSCFFSRLIHSSTNHRLRKIPLNVSLGIRFFFSGSSDSSNEEIESECDNDEEDDEIEINSSADPEDLKK